LFAMHIQETKTMEQPWSLFSCFLKDVIRHAEATAWTCTPIQVPSSSSNLCSSRSRKKKLGSCHIFSCRSWAAGCGGQYVRLKAHAGQFETGWPWYFRAQYIRTRRKGSLVKKKSSLAEFLTVLVSTVLQFFFWRQKTVGGRSPQ
jgi:hypothetical protein